MAGVGYNDDLHVRRSVAMTIATLAPNTVPAPNNPQKGAVIPELTHRPDPGIASQLINEGPMIASGILVRYPKRSLPVLKVPATLGERIE